MPGDLEKEGENWDSILSVVLPLVSAFFAGAVSPEVANAEGWLGVFIATLAWSLGVAVATYAIASNNLQSWDAVGAVAASLAVSVSIAAGLGIGALEVAPEFSGGGHPLVSFILGIGYAALLTYGWFGTLIGGAIGVWLGLLAKRHLG